MRKLFLIVSFLSINVLLFANQNPKPEKIHRITRVHKTFDYYQEQVGLWKTEAEKNKTDVDAWLNYYTAVRVGNMVKGEKVFDATAIANQVAENIPNTFEGNYIQYWETQEDKYLDKAYEIDPNRWETYQAFIARYELKRDSRKVKEFSKKMYESGVYSTGVMTWNYNVMMSVEENAILLTGGDNDTYPIWMLQSAKNFRTDIKAINLWLLMRKPYQNLLFEELGMPTFSKKADDFNKISDHQEALIKHLIKHSGLPIYFAGTATPTKNKDLMNNLYLVGLAYKYSEVVFDNIAVLRSNVENDFMLDYLTLDINKDLSKTVVDRMNQHYLVPFLKLHHYYKENGEMAKMTKMKNYLTPIAKESGREMEIMGYLQEKKTNAKIRVDVDVKNLDKRIKTIKEGLWAEKTEVTIKEYELFLMDLLKRREFEQLNEYKIMKTDWKALLPTKYQHLPDNKIFEHGHPDEEYMPVQGITHEAAKAYCAWLTQAYNTSTYKKKKYKKVIFRLPTEAEWEFTARGGHDLAPYPWGGYYSTNAKGCYLSNFNVVGATTEELSAYKPEEPCEDCPEDYSSNDGGFFPVYSTAYFPNDYGFYNMSGNVAEMVAEKGIAKGGSWEDRPNECQVTSKKTYTAPSPAIGFRVFMEVIEEKP